MGKKNGGGGNRGKPAPPRPPSVPTTEPPEMDRRAMIISAPKTDGLPVSMPGTSASLPKTSGPLVSITDSRIESGPESSRAHDAPLPKLDGGGNNALSFSKRSEERGKNYVSPPPMTKSFKDIISDPRDGNNVQFGSFDLVPGKKPEGRGNNAPGPSRRIDGREKDNVSTRQIVPPGEVTNDLVPMNRPDRGAMINPSRSVKLLVNHFHVAFDERRPDIFHYELGITKANSTVEIKNREDCVKIKNELLREHAASFGNATIVHDGKRNIYSLELLETQEFYIVRLAEGVYNVTVQHTHNIQDRRRYLLNFLDVGNQRHVDFKDFQDYLQCLDLVIREDPSQNKLLVGRSLYPDPTNSSDPNPNQRNTHRMNPNRQRLPDEYRDVGNGAMTAEGFYQSLRPTAQGLALILDLSAGTFYKSISVIEYLKESVLMGVVPPSLSEAQRRDVEKALRGLKIRVTHRNGGRRKYTIRGLTEQITTDITFEARSNDGPMVRRLVDFFYSEHNYPIEYDRLPCLDLSRSGERPNYVPMELCVLCEGQRFRRDKDRSSRDNSKPPLERLQRINRIINSEYVHRRDSIVSRFHLRVEAGMTQVTGRVLERPKLHSRTIFEGKPIENCCIINFGSLDSLSPQEKQVVEKFAESLKSKCNNLGIKINGRPLFQHYSMASFNEVESIRKILGKVREKTKNVDSLIVICVMEKKHPGYHILKLIAETEIGLITQCCLYGKIREPTPPYLENLALKMNAKMGGINSAFLNNSSLQVKLPNSQVMYIGADVNHPNPGDKDSPSVAAVVGSINWPSSNRYNAKIRYQTHRNEQIEELRDMTKELLDDYKKENKKLPDRILFFRDGVSESQFEMVLKNELSALKEAVALFKDYRSRTPLISIIVAQKRHHTRLFLQEMPNKKENVPAGTVVDTTIVHPRQFDFYLCSHYGHTGTSKPTHYHVLMDENKFTSDELQRLIYNLCYTFARCRGSVSLVPPVYYADLAAYRGRCYLHGLSSFTARTAASTSSAASSTQNEYPKIKKPVSERMFFC